MVLCGGGFTGVIPDDVMARVLESEREARRYYDDLLSRRTVYERIKAYLARIV